MTVVLDTCTILWAVSDPERLSPPAVSLLEADDTEVCVSAISCAEIACAADRGRIVIDRHWRLWFRHYVELNGWTVLPVELESVEEAYALPGSFHRDPADRIIVAEARRRSAPVVTADARILDYQPVAKVRIRDRQDEPDVLHSHVWRWVRRVTMVLSNRCGWRRVICREAQGILSTNG